MRTILYPYTALHLKEQKQQKVDDYIKAAEAYHASHLLSYSMTDNSTYFKVCKLPKGPTATFKVNSFTLAKDIVSSHSLNKTPNSAPLLIMSGFGKEHGASETARLVSVLLQSIFPPINIHAINLERCKRVILFSHAKGSGPIRLEFRHYEVSTRQRNVNKAVALLSSIGEADCQPPQHQPEQVRRHLGFHTKARRVHVGQRGGGFAGLAGDAATGLRTET